MVPVGSILADNPSPQIIMYSASKKFVKTFSDLTRSWGGSSCHSTLFDMTHLEPGTFQTQMSGYLELPFFSNSVEKTAHGVTRNFGVSKNTAGSWNHQVQTLIFGSFPRPMVHQSNKGVDEAFLRSILGMP
uniref:Uncharacterized protein n=1 Tax=Strombidium inclinatum TaxID=197538 RepID=A0A7S3IQ32_9SPIT|mmetsp:Transcript_31118/g.47549  ORF Transcript_31118/g.47549 Transcript_31118/m.47549 type:complete len:131 (+) Transcript_31118:571-963(+)